MVQIKFNSTSVLPKQSVLPDGSDDTSVVQEGVAARVSS